MKPVMKKIFVISGILILVGGILIAGTLLLSKGPFGVYSIDGKWRYVGDEQEKTTIHETVPKFSSIDIDFDSGKVELIPSDDYRFEFDGVLTGEKFTYAVENGTLKIQMKYKPIRLQLNYMDYPYSNKNENILRVYYPEGTQFDIVKIDSGSSEVNVSGVEAGDFQLTNDFGTLILDEIKAKNMQVNASSGSINLKNIIAENLTLNADYGSQTMTDVVATTSLTINKTSGTLDMDSVTATKVKISSDYGEIKGEKLKLKDVNMNSTNGKIDLAGSIKGIFDITIDYGNVRLDLEEKHSDYNISTEIDYGTVLVDGQEILEKHKENNGGENEMNINSSSGHFELNFAQ